MKKLLTTIAVLAAVATPVLAQAQGYSYRANGASSGVPDATQTNEAARYDHAKGEIE